jgi:RNA polymerase sigma-70 factor, ECF subfamily
LNGVALVADDENAARIQAGGAQHGHEIGAEILAAARRGDQRAFIAVLRHYDPRLRLLAWRLLQDRDDMDDAMQEAAIKAYRSLGKFRGDSGLGTWLYRITYTTCLDHLRRRQPRELLAAEVPSPSDVEADPAVVVQELEDLRLRLSALSAEQRAAVILVDEQDLDYRTAAEILRVPVGTLASRLAAARAVLRAAYEQTPSGEA